MSSRSLSPSGTTRRGSSYRPASPTVLASGIAPSVPLSTSAATSVPMLVQLASQMTPLELNAPILQTSTRKAFEIFIPLFQAYVTKRGTQPLSTLMAVNVQTVYAERLSVSLPDFLMMSSVDLMKAICGLHGVNVIGVGFTDTLESVVMQDTLEYDRTECELYMENFLALLHRVPTLRDPLSGGATEAQLAKAFIKGIFPVFFRLLVDQRKPNTLKAALASFTEFFSHMDMYNTIALARRSSESLVGKPAPTRPKAPFRFPSRHEGHKALLSSTAPVSAPISGRGGCFNCQGAHHYQACPQRSVCLPCNSTSHACWASNCPARSRWESSRGVKARVSASHPPVASSDAVAPGTTVADMEALVTRLVESRLLSVLGETDPVRACLCASSRPILIDTGCNHTICASESHSDSPITLSSTRRKVEVATGALAEITGTAVVHGLDSLFVPSFEDSLLSVSQYTACHNACALFFCDSMIGITLTPAIKQLINDACTLARQRNLITLSGVVSNGLYTMTPSKSLYAGASFYATAELSSLASLVRFFHEAWNHASEDLMVAIVQHNIFTNIPPALTTSAIRKYFPLCPTCPIGNLARIPPPPSSSESRVLSPGEEIVMDCKVFADNKGMRHQQTFGGCKFTLTAIDVSTGYHWGFLLKSQASLEQYCETLRLEIVSAGRTLRRLRTDNAFVTNALKAWCLLHRVILSPCIPHEHYQIGLVERFHRSLEDSIVKCISNKPHLTMQYWGFAYNDIIMKSNILPTILRPTTTPYELWHGSKLDLKVTPMLPFGSVVMAHIPLALQRSLGPRSVETFVVGCSLAHVGGLLLYNPTTKRVIIRRSFKTIGPTRPPSLTYSLLLDYDSLVAVPSPSDDLLVDSSLPVSDVVPTVGLPPTSIMPPPVSVTQAVSRRTHVCRTYRPSRISAVTSVPLRCIRAELRARLTATRNATFWSEPLPASSVLVNQVAPVFVAPSHTPSIPRSYRDLLLMPLGEERTGYLDAVRSEMSSMASMDAFSDLSIPLSDIPRSKIISSKFIFDAKFHPDGTFQKYKCRLVARGDRWIDHYSTKTFAGTVKSESVRLLLCIAAELDLELLSVDVRTAFLYPTIPADEPIYMRRPTGLTDADMPLVVRLNKCIYGLPMASAQFREHSDSTLRSLGFVPLASDTCVYQQHYPSGEVAYILVHVDDFGIAATTSTLAQQIKLDLQRTYVLTSMDNFSYYLGLHITRDRAARSITIRQSGYIDDILQTYSIPCDGSVPFPSTPMLAPSTNSSQLDRTLLASRLIVDYQARVGSLIYLASQSRPDILFAVTQAARQTSAPTIGDYTAVLRIFLYLAGTRSLGLCFHSGEGVVLYATVDASYANHLDRKSHTGCTLHIGKHSGSFHSRSKKQTITADSSTVAEFIAAHFAAKEIMWARSFLAELGFPQPTPTILFEDNKSTIAMIENQSNTQRTKHIDIRYNMIREQVIQQVIRMEHLATTEMTSDALTKALAPTSFLHLRPRLLGMLIRSRLSRCSKNLVIA